MKGMQPCEYPARRLLGVTLGFVLALACPRHLAGQDAMALPDNVQAVWDTARAYHEATPTRERICLNGLWRWQPADAASEQVPMANWGYFKVPGCWPGITDYMQKDCQTVFAHPSWKDQRLGGITAAWYQRDIDNSSRLGWPPHHAESRISQLLRGGLTSMAAASAKSGSRGATWTSPRRAARASSTSSACSSWPCRWQGSCFPTPTPPRPGKSRARWPGAACAATCTWLARPAERASAT